MAKPSRRPKVWSPVHRALATTSIVMGAVLALGPLVLELEATRDISGQSGASPYLEHALKLGLLLWTAGIGWSQRIAKDDCAIELRDALSEG